MKMEVKRRTGKMCIRDRVFTDADKSETTENNKKIVKYAFKEDMRRIKFRRLEIAVLLHCIWFWQ